MRWRAESEGGETTRPWFAATNFYDRADLRAYKARVCPTLTNPPPTALRTRHGFIGGPNKSFVVGIEQEGSLPHRQGGRIHRFAGSGDDFAGGLDADAALNGCELEGVAGDQAVVKQRDGLSRNLWRSPTRDGALAPRSVARGGTCSNALGPMLANRIVAADSPKASQALCILSNPPRMPGHDRLHVGKPRQEFPRRDKFCFESVPIKARVKLPRGALGSEQQVPPRPRDPDSPGNAAQINHHIRIGRIIERKNGRNEAINRDRLVVDAVARWGQSQECHCYLLCPLTAGDEAVGTRKPYRDGGHIPLASVVLAALPTKIDDGKLRASRRGANGGVDARLTVAGCRPVRGLRPRAAEFAT